MSSITLLTPAKVNLTLEVLGARPDGYHEIRSIIQPIDLFDEVRIELTDGKGIEVRSSGADIPEGKDNLAWQAADIFLGECGLDNGVTVTIRKQIPVGSGLGGGSSNAAAVLTGLYRITRALPEEQLFAIAPRLGADVSLFLRPITSVIEGIGDRVIMVKDFPLLYYVILYPNVRVSTAKVYQKWDELNKGEGKKKALCDINETIALFKGDASELPLGNDLEQPAFELHPEIKSFKRILDSLGARNILMTGSGSAVFAAFRDELEAFTIYEYLKTTPTFQVFFARGITGWHRLI